MQMRSYGRPQGLLLHIKVRLSILCVSFHSGLMAGLDFCTQAVGGWLNKYLYQPGVESWTSSSLGCTDIWWQFIYLYSIWNLFHSKMGQLPIYGLFAYVFQAVLFYFVASIRWPFFSRCLASDSPGGSLKLVKLIYLLASLKMYWGLQFQGLGFFGFFFCMCVIAVTWKRKPFYYFMLFPSLQSASR